MMLYSTSTFSAYLENICAWVAAHDLDGGLAQRQIDMYVTRDTRSPLQFRDKSNFLHFKEFLLKAKGALLDRTELGTLRSLSVSTFQRKKVFMGIVSSATCYATFQLMLFKIQTRVNSIFQVLKRLSHSAPLYVIC